MADLTVNVAGVTFKNPIIPASGAFGFGREYEEFYPLSKLGGVAVKGMTLLEKPEIRRRVLQKRLPECLTQLVCKIPELTISLSMSCRI